MAKLGKLRISLTAKLLMMFLTVLLVAIVIFGEIAFKTASTGMQQGVYNQINGVSSTVVNQIVAINQRHFQMLHSLAEITDLKDESIPLAEKQRLLVSVAKAVGENCENIAFYDAEGNAITADGRLMNFAARPYFAEAFAGKDFIISRIKYRAAIL
jgi:methyl-accepting chemotaxis protein